MTFRCNICDARTEAAPAAMRRDEPSCSGCGSSTRLRALMHALSLELFGTPVALADFPVLKSIRGLGLSDNRECATILAEKFDYRNTYFHQEPRFDITRIPDNERGVYDFVIASEVLEHVPPPVEKAFASLFALLKPGGFAAVTTPYSTDATTLEHFPEMQDYQVISVGGHLALVNRTAAGKWQVFDNLVFHGGDGATVEVRLFSETDLRANLTGAGFQHIRFLAEDYPPFGVVHEGAWGVPIVAGRERFRLSSESIAEILRQHALLSEQRNLLESERVRLEAERIRLEGICRDLNAHVQRVEAELEERGHWTTSVNEEVTGNRREIARLQERELELIVWAEAEGQECKRLQAEIQRLQAEAEERTPWALRLEDEGKQRSQDVERLARDNERLRRLLQSWEASRWSHLGRVLGLGPKLP